MLYKNKACNNIVDSFKTGDIVLFHGDGSVDKFIEMTENTPWSHVGMILNPADVGLSNICGDRTLLWHSTPKLNVNDVEIKSKNYGPEIVYLDDILNFLKDYNYLVVVRKLDTYRSNKMITQLNQFIKKVHNDSFPKNPQLILEYIIGILMNVLNHIFKKNFSYNDASIIKNIENSGLKFIIENFSKKPYLIDMHTEFCSELIAQTYIEMGLLSKENIPEGFSPKSFSSQVNMILNNAKLEKEITISSPSKEESLSVS